MEAGRRRGCGLAVRREEDVLGEGHVTCEVPGDRRSACGGREGCLCREQGGETTVGNGAITTLGRGLLQPGNLS